MSRVKRFRNVSKTFLAMWVTSEKAEYKEIDCEEAAKNWIQHVKEKIET